LDGTEQNLRELEWNLMRVSLLRLILHIVQPMPAVDVPFLPLSKSLWLDLSCLVLFCQYIQEDVSQKTGPGAREFKAKKQSKDSEQDFSNWQPLTIRPYSIGDGDRLMP
jgi:hypothetical protein